MKKRVAAVCLLGAWAAWAQGGFDGPGSYEIRNLKSGQALDLDRDRITLAQNPPRDVATQRWIISPAAPGYFYIRNAATEAALEIIKDSNSAPVLAQSREDNPNQHWRIEAGKDGNALLISRFGKALDVPDGSSREGLRLQIYDRNGDSNQRFTFRRVGGVLSNLVPPIGRGRERGGRYFDERDHMWKLRGDGACFYRETNFRGDSICIRAGEDLPDVFRESPGTFRSLKFFGGSREVLIYERPAFRGGINRITRDASNLGRAGERMGSLQVP